MSKTSDNEPSEKDLLEEILRAAEYIIPEKGIQEKLALAKSEKRRLRIKMGFDPTSPDLHLGHAVSMVQLKRFQDMGHLLVIIIGDFTALIGDPGGRDKSRPVVPAEEIKKNATTYITQLGKLLDIDDVEVHTNSDWLKEMTLSDLIPLLRQGSLAQTIARNDFRKRLDDGSPIGLHEVIFSIIQGYDSVAIKADIELGGVDQLYSFQAARMLQTNRGDSPQASVMMPLLTGLDGTKKMSKSLGNHVGLSDAPRDMFGKVMSIPDTLIEEYLHLTSTFSLDEIHSLLEEMKSGRNPMEIKTTLAKNITTTYHDEDKAQDAEDFFARQFRSKEKDIEYQLMEIEDVKEPIALIMALGAATSNSRARTLVVQGALKINGKKIDDIDHKIKNADGLEVKVGKRLFFKTSVKKIKTSKK